MNKEKGESLSSEIMFAATAQVQKDVYRSQRRVSTSLIYARSFLPPRNPFKMKSIITDPLL